MKKAPSKKFLTNPFNRIEIILESMNDKIELLANGQQMLFERFERLSNEFNEHKRDIIARVSILEMGQFTIEKEIKKLAKKLH